MSVVVEYLVSIEREREILADLEFALDEHGPGSEPWMALVKELREQQARTAELGRQLDVLAERHLENDPIRSGLRDHGAALARLFREHRPGLLGLLRKEK